MCDQCDQLQKKISHFREFLGKFDPLTDDRMKAMIVELERRKDAMHKAAGVGSRRAAFRVTYITTEKR